MTKSFNDRSIKDWLEGMQCISI